MTKTIKDSFEADIKTVADLLPRRMVNKDKVQRFPAVSLIPLGTKNERDAEGKYRYTFRCGLALFVESQDVTKIDNECDDLFDLLEECEYPTLGLYAESIEFLSHDYDDYNGGTTKGVSYVSVEIKFYK